MNTIARKLNAAVESVTSRHFGILPTGNTAVNQACRNAVDELASRYGQIYLGRTTITPASADYPCIWAYDGRGLKPHTAAFAVPCNDSQLARLILDRYDAPNASHEADAQRMAAILARVEAIGGIILIWS